MLSFKKYWNLLNENYNLLTEYKAICVSGNTIYYNTKHSTHNTILNAIQSDTNEQLNDDKLQCGYISHDLSYFNDTVINKLYNILTHTQPQKIELYPNIFKISVTLQNKS